MTVISSGLTTMSYNKVSNCCEARAEVEGMEDSGICSDCGEHCEYVCEHCGGEGTVTVDEAVYPGEPHMAPIGTQKCICQIREDDGSDD